MAVQDNGERPRNCKKSLMHNPAFTKRRKSSKRKHLGGLATNLSCLITDVFLLLQCGRVLMTCTTSINNSTTCCKFALGNIF